MSSAKTAGIILGILVPLILIVFFVILYCRRIAEEEDPELYYTEKTVKHNPIKLSPIMQRNNEDEGGRGSISAPITTMDPPLADNKESMNILRAVPIERLEILEGSPRSSRGSSRASSSSSKRDGQPNGGGRKRSGTSGSGYSAATATPPPPPPLAQQPKQPSNYDGVYYTGEPLPGRADVDFPPTSSDDEDKDASPRRAFVSPKVSV